LTRTGGGANECASREGDVFVVAVAQLVRASACGAEGRGFKSHQPPHPFRKPRLASDFNKINGLHSFE